MPSEFDRIAAVEAFKELGGGFGIMRSQKEDDIDKIHPDAGFLESRMKEALFMEASDKVGIGTGFLCVYDSSLDIQIMLGVEKVVVGEDKLGDLDKKWNGW